MNSEFFDTTLHPFPQTKPILDHEDVPFFGSLPDLLRSIHSILGLEIVFVRAGGTLPDMMARCFTIKVEGGKSPGHLVLMPTQFSQTQNSPMTFAQQNEFLNSLALLLGDAYRWQQRFRKYEEDLATLIPIPSPDLSCQRFTETLYDILKEATKILGFHAASLYLLDAGNSTLKLRSCWGLPEERLLDPPRNLHDSLGDMEAILGQVVVLNDSFLLDSWNAPEDFATAVCVPVMSPMSIIGTLWFYSDKRREFDARGVSLMEMITGRLAAELERAALLRELGRESVVGVL